MRWVLVLLAALILVPIAEIAVIVAVGQQIGPLPTVLLLLGSAVVGTWLLKREGARTLRALRAASQEGRTPAQEAIEGLLVVVGGLMMMLPGFVTDILGLMLVISPTRRLGARFALHRIVRRLPPDFAADLLGPMRVKSRRGRPDTPPNGTRPPGTPPQGPPQGRGKVIEGEIEP